MKVLATDIGGERHNVTTHNVRDFNPPVQNPTLSKKVLPTQREGGRSPLRPQKGQDDGLKCDNQKKRSGSYRRGGSRPAQKRNFIYAEKKKRRSKSTDIDGKKRYQRHNCWEE